MYVYNVVYIISCHLYSSFCFQALRGFCNMRYINIYHYYYINSENTPSVLWLGWLSQTGQTWGHTLPPEWVQAAIALKDYPNYVTANPNNHLGDTKQSAIRWSKKISPSERGKKVRRWEMGRQDVELKNMVGLNISGSCHCVFGLFSPRCAKLCCVFVWDNQCFGNEGVWNYYLS